MKTMFLCILSLTSICCFASGIDSLFQRHQLNFSMTNGVSDRFYDGPMGPTRRYNESFSENFINQNFSPSYTIHVRLAYSLGLSKNVRLETGLGYQLNGLIIHQIYGGLVPEGSYDSHFYIGSLTVPIHVKFIQQLQKGAFTYALGPSFNFPIHNFEKNTNIQGQYYESTTHIHYKFNSDASLAASSVGFDFNFSYELGISKNWSADIGPIIDFNNLVLLNTNLEHAYTQLRYRPYNYEIGLNLAINFGLKK